MTPAKQVGKIDRNQPKLTKGCRRVLEVLEQSHQLTTAQSIYGLLRQTEPESPGLTTIYRSLDSLVEMGLVQAVNLGDGEKRYEIVEPGEHHHHLICDSCNASVHLDQCVIEDLEKSIKTKYGFVISSHVLEVFGQCRDCLKSAAKRK